MKKDKLLCQLQDAFQRLKEALEIPVSEPLTIDGTIQRFEFTFELAWKAIKSFMEDQGVLCHSPKSCIKEAFKMGWIHSEEEWLALLKARNMTTHVYNEASAMGIYKEIHQRHDLFQALIKELANQQTQQTQQTQ
ncbi:MAG: nucleotidyltransferase substrate binding protein [Proteobacteria bacterium]|nr:nucleotidyltransferase substrate binding protein [Pseudomonadota bacterium]